MGLSMAGAAFHDALANNQSEQELMGDEVLMTMARELAARLRGNLSIDWPYKERARATTNDDQSAAQTLQISPDQEAETIDLVLQQIEMILREWSRENQHPQATAAPRPGRGL